jgi:hypothetical protein
MTEERNSIYRWVPGFHQPKGLSADVAQAELERIQAANGRLDAHMVVRESRPQGAPLHQAFEWDDVVAAERYRTEQAQHLIRAIVKIGTAKEPECRTWVLVRRPEEKETEYLPVRVVVQDSDLFADAMQRLKQQLQGAQKSIQELRNLTKHLDSEAGSSRKWDKAEKHLGQVNRVLGFEQPNV